MGRNPRLRCAFSPRPTFLLSVEDVLRPGGVTFEIDGTSPTITELKDQMLRVARDPEVTVLIVGESGTGKERIARAIHERSPRARAPFAIVNCAGLSPTLAEDELFGHVRGAFTGAFADRAGPFERADHGTVFLDEIGELTMDLQVKLLRILQERTVQRLGSVRETSFDVRIIAATHVDLRRAISQRRFREDLYYRLKVYELRVPALRMRGATDVQALVRSNLERLCARRHREAVNVSPGLMKMLTRYRWPGNVRELENALERMLVAAAGEEVLTLAHLPDDFGPVGEDEEVSGPDRSHVFAPCRRRLPTAREASEALERHGYKRGKAAAALGISRHQLYRLVRSDVIRRRDVA